jgi:hypothetical protein
MRLLYKPFLTIVLLITFQFVYAQKNKGNFGYIITVQNDTLPCSFKTANWKKQPKQINIKLADKDSTVLPENINGFIISSLQVEYISKDISMANYVDKLQDATISKVPQLAAPQKLFLKTLYKGGFNLYVCSDGINRKHFFIEGPGNFVELYSHYYLEMGDSRRVYDQPITIFDKKYEFVLKTLMTECRTLFSIIENISLNEDQLIQVLKLYDKCTESKKNE